MPIGPALVGFAAGARTLNDLNERDRRRTLEDVILKRDAGDRELERARRDAQLRGEGYIPETEAGPDASASLDGRTLDSALSAMRGDPAHTAGSPGFDVPARYSSPVGGYVFDRRSPAARRAAAEARRAERLADGSTERKEPEASFTERQSAQIQRRIRELTSGGMALAAANRQARLEAGESAPTLESRLSEGREPPRVRDARRAADRNRMLLNTTSRELTALNKEIGAYPDRADTTSGRIARRDRLGVRRDSLESEVDKYSQMATEQSLDDLVSVAPTGGVDDARLHADLAEARQAYEASLRLPNANRADVQRRYRELVATIRARHARGEH